MVYIDDSELKKYFETYIEAYGEAVKAAGKPGQEPELYKSLPFKVDIFKMPNEAVIAIMYGKSPKAMYTVYDGEWDQVAGYLDAKAHQQCLVQYPTKNFSADDAKADAKAAVGKDTRATIYRAGLMAARTHIEDIGKQIGEIAKANPWLEKQLKDLETKLIKSKAPLDKLWEEYKKVDEMDMYQDQVMRIREVQGLEPSAPPEVDNKSVEEYINTYVDTYKKAIKPEYPDHAKPPFYKGAPHKVRATILPNKSIAVLFKDKAIVEVVEVAEGSYDNVKALIDNKEYGTFMHLPPLKDLSPERASTDAKLKVKEDIRNTLHLALLQSTSKVIADHQEKIKEIMKTNPWLEGPLSSISNRLQGVGKLLEVLTEEIESNQLHARPPDQKRLLQEVSRYRSPKRTATEQPAYEAPEVPAVVEAPPEVVSAKAEAVTVAQPPAAAKSSGPLFMPASAIAGESFPDEEEVAPQQQVYDQSQYGYQQPMVTPGMTEDEKAQMNELRAEVYEMRKKVDEFDRKINYMDKYIETQVQRRQDEKFKEQEEVYSSMIKRYSGVATGLGISAIIISLMVLVFNIEPIMNALGSLFG